MQNPAPGALLRPEDRARSDVQSVQSGTTVSLRDEEGVKRILVDTIFGLWGIVNNLTRLRPTRRERYRVTILGSARAKPGTLAFLGA